MRWNEFGKFLIVALAIIGGFCVYISPLANSIKQGLDLQGGTHVVLQLWIRRNLRLTMTLSTAV